MLLHRKNDKLEASSRSLIRYGVSGGVFGGSRSMRKRNSGPANILSSAASIPASKPSSLRSVSYTRSRVRTSFSVTGRRYARCANVERILLAQDSSSAARTGRHTKIFLRLALSLIPVALYGPLMTILSRAGSPPLYCTISNSVKRRRNTPSATRFLFRKVTPTKCSPAFAAKRASKFASAPPCSYTSFSGVPKPPACEKSGDNLPFSPPIVSIFIFSPSNQNSS